MRCTIIHTFDPRTRKRTQCHSLIATWLPRSSTKENYISRNDVRLKVLRS